MKKFKFLFLLVAMFATMGMCMVGCNGGDNSNSGEGLKQPQETNSVLTINETKTIVLNALSINNANTLGINLNVSKNEIGNRNVFVKFGTAKLIGQSAGLDFSGVFSKNTQGDILHYYSQNSNMYDYFDGEYVYSKYEDNYSKNEFNFYRDAVMFNSFDCVFLDLLFIDEAWNTIYNSQVNKTITDNGYDLDMSINMNTYCDFVMNKAGTLELGAEGLFGEDEVLEKNKTDGVAKLKISMNSSNEMTSLILDITSFSTLENQDQTKLTVEKFNDTFTAPSWFNIENYQ